MKFPCELFLLDLGNVLVKFDHHLIVKRLADLSGKSGMIILAQFLQSGLGEDYDEGRLNTDQFVASCIDQLELNVSADEFIAIWNGMFCENPGMEELLVKIKQRYPIYVLSDTNPLHFEYCRETFPLLKHVDEFILSYEIGVRKPDSAMFGAALKKAGSSADKTLFADDRKEIIKGARKQGFQSLLYRDAAGFERDLSDWGLLEG